jgi:hypothetical protein
MSTNITIASKAGSGASNFGYYNSGYYYNGSITAGTFVDRTLHLNEIIGAPYIFPENLETDEIRINVRSTGTATLGRFYIADSNADGSLKSILYVSDNIAINSTGIKIQNLPLTVFKKNTPYWFIFQVNGAVGMECINLASCVMLGTSNAGAANLCSIRNITSAGFPLFNITALKSSVDYPGLTSNQTPICFKIKKV